MHTRTLCGLAIAQLATGTGLALTGLYPDIDRPALSRLGLLLVLCSIPPWNALLLRRARLVSDDQLADTFDAGYRLCVTHLSRTASEHGPGDINSAWRRDASRVSLPGTTEERRDR